MLIDNQCGQIGRFFKVLVNKFSYKSRPNILGHFLGYSDKRHFKVKNCCDYYLGNFWKNLGYFLLLRLVTL